MCVCVCVCVASLPTCGPLKRPIYVVTSPTCGPLRLQGLSRHFDCITTLATPRMAGSFSHFAHLWAPKTASYAGISPICVPLDSGVMSPV